jgi:hypothetical protein
MPPPARPAGKAFFLVVVDNRQGKLLKPPQPWYLSGAQHMSSIAIRNMLGVQLLS